MYLFDNEGISENVGLQLYSVIVVDSIFLIVEEEREEEEEVEVEVRVEEEEGGMEGIEERGKEGEGR